MTSASEYFTPPAIAQPQVSPDGSMKAYLRWTNDGPAVHVTLDDIGKGWRVSPREAGGVFLYRWLSMSRIVAVDGRRSTSVLWLLDVDPGTEPIPLEFPQHSLVRLLGPSSEDETSLLVAINARSERLSEPYRVDLTSGSAERLATNDGSVVQWLSDPGGRILGAYSAAGEWRTILHRADEKSDFAEVRRFHVSDLGLPLGYSPDLSVLYVKSAEDSLWFDLVAIRIPDGEVVHAWRFGKDLEGFYANSVTGDPLVATYFEPETGRLSCEPVSEVGGWLAEALSRETGDLIGLTTDRTGTRCMAILDVVKSPGVGIVYSKEGCREIFAAPYVYRLGAGEAPYRVLRGSIATGDGLKVWHELIEPKDKLPSCLIVMPHGGPWSHDGSSYSSVVHYFTDLGFSVLRVDYRGSTGYGKTFIEAATGELSGRSVSDVIECIERTLERESRFLAIGMYGESFGGYLALLCALELAELIRAVVTVGAPVDLASFMLQSPVAWTATIDGTWHRFAGDPRHHEVRRELMKVSPLGRVAELDVPSLFVHGARDPKVNVSGCRKMASALTQRGVTSELMILNDEHVFWDSKNTIRALEKAGSFFKDHLHQPGPDREGEQKLGMWE